MPDSRYDETRRDLKKHSLANLERLSKTVTTPVIRKAVADEARDRLTDQANAAYDAGAR